MLEEGYAIRASDIDVIYAYGFGFPRHRGGPMFYADTVGLPTVLARVKDYRERFGDYWQPAPLLERLVAEGRGFYIATRRSRRHDAHHRRSRARRQHVGEELAVSDWIAITQERIDALRARRPRIDSGFTSIRRARRPSRRIGTTIAHGFLTLSLVSVLLRQAVTIGGLRMAVNYGLNRVRFVAPVPAGARIRGRFVLGGIETRDEGIQATWGVRVEREGGEKPCLVAEWIVRYYPA